jgi:hypothetical protein
MAQNAVSVFLTHRSMVAMMLINIGYLPRPL